MDTLRVGIVGLGIMGRTYADALTAFDGTSVTAIAEVSAKGREEAVQRYGCAVFESYEAMFEKTALDMVIIAVPDFLHRGPVIAAAQAGVPMLIEKPFAMNMDDARVMLAAIEKAAVKCTIEFGNRWMTQFVQARERIQKGDLGEVLSVGAELNDTLFVPTKMLSWAGRSSPAWFLMAHTADITTWVTGKKPARVFASGTKKLLPSLGVDTWDVVEAVVDYDDGTTGRLTSGWVLPRALPLVYEFKARFVGSLASIDIDMSDQGMHFVTHDRYEHPHTASGLVRGRYVGSLFNMLRDFIDDVREDRLPSVTVRDGFENTRFVVAVHQSLETGSPVSLDSI